MPLLKIGWENGNCVFRCNNISLKSNLCAFLQDVTKLFSTGLLHFIFFLFASHFEHEAVYFNTAVVCSCPVYFYTTSKSVKLSILLNFCKDWNNIYLSYSVVLVNHPFSLFKRFYSCSVKKAKPLSEEQ